MPEVSIIIPVVEINEYIRESIPYILAQTFGDFEIIIFPDIEAKASFDKTRIIPTGKMGPAEKRDLAIKNAGGKILAFLDDDAYPEPDWLKKALRHFNDDSISAVGGPAITPVSDSFKQRVSGAVFLTKIGGGNPERYWPMGSIKDVDDWPSVNLLVRKDVFTAIGGFHSEYWPGEDTKLCLDIIEKGGRIIYDPGAVVWHHRREGFFRHLKQIGGYGLHRGFFAKRYPKNSFKLKYFIPSLFVVYILILIINIFINNQYACYSLLGILPYLAALSVGAFNIYTKEKNFSISLTAIVYIFFTHIWYGIKFLQGFIIINNLKSRLRS